MKEVPNISFIIPVYNMADTLPDTLKSLLSVSGLFIEIIIINDGSTDEFQEVIDRFADRFKRNENSSLKIDSISKNSGRAEAINLGVHLSTGTYITFLDADDTIDSSELMKLWDCAKNSDAEMVIGQFKIVDDEGNLMTKRSLDPGLDPKKLIRKIAFYPLSPITLNATLINRTFFLETGFFEKSNVKAQDKDMTLRLLRSVNHLVICDSYHYLYRKLKLPKKKLLLKRIEWLFYRQKTIRNNFSGVTLIASMFLQFFYDVCKLLYELFIGYRK